MTQYNSLNIKLSNSQLNRLKSAIKDETKVVLRLVSNMISNPDDKTNFPYKLLLTNRQVVILCKAFANNSSLNTELSKLSYLKNRWFHGRFLGPLLKTGLPLTKNVIKPLPKRLLIPLGLTAAAAITGAGIHENVRFGNDSTNKMKWWNGRYYENS